MHPRVIVDDPVYFLTIHFGSWSFILDSNLRSIGCDFLINDEIGRLETEMKRMPNINGKIHFGLLTFKITQIIRFRCLNFFKIQFRCKGLFLLFFSSWLREEIERSLDSDGREREVSLTPIYITKIIDICVKWFYLTREVHIMCFLTL